MFKRDYKDIVGGALLILVGLSFSLYAATHYPLGTPRRMGPGMFPAGAGAVLALLGSTIAVPALFRSGVMPAIELRSPLLVLAGVIAFALVIKPFGLIPAILAVTIISSFADTEVYPRGLALLCLCLCVVAWLTFGLGLGLAIPMASWPF